jgi:hypothetical protein
MLDIFEERSHNSLGVELWGSRGGLSEVKQVTVLLPLIKSAKLRTQELFNRVGYEVGLSSKPRVFGGELLSNIAEDEEVFPRIDLNLQSKQCDRRDFRVEAIDESDSPFGLFSARFSEP